MSSRITVERLYRRRHDNEWYIFRSDDEMYLHNDGTWHSSTIVDGIFSGLYDSKADADKVLTSFLKSQSAT